MAFETTVEMKLEGEAKFGLFRSQLKIGLNKANSLRAQGFNVTDLHEVNYFPRMHYISWKDNKVDCENLDSLDENSDKLTFAQKLWVISTKNHPKTKQEKSLNEREITTK